MPTTNFVADVRRKLPHTLDKVAPDPDRRRVKFGAAYRDFLRRHALAELDLAPDYFDRLRCRRPGRRVRL